MSKTINQEKLNASLRMLDKMGEQNLELMKAADPQQAARQEQASVLLGDESFCKQLFSCADTQAAVQLFADRGLDLTEDEVKLLLVQIYAIAKRLMDNDGELSEEDLEQISGGHSAAEVWAVGTLSFWSLMGLGGKIGSAIGTCVLPGAGTAVGTVIGLVVGGLTGVATTVLYALGIF